MLISKRRTFNRSKRIKLRWPARSKATSTKSANSRKESKSSKNPVPLTRVNSRTRSLCKPSKSRLARMKYRNFKTKYKCRLLTLKNWKENLMNSCRASETKTKISRRSWQMLSLEPMQIISHPPERATSKIREVISRRNSKSSGEHRKRELMILKTNLLLQK